MRENLDRERECKRVWKAASAGREGWGFRDKSEF